MAVVSLAACGETDAGEPGERRPEDREQGVRVVGDTVFVASEPAELIGLDVRIPPRRAYARMVETTGRVAADPTGTAAVSAPAAGRIEAIRVAPGDPVRRGQPLVRLSSPEYVAGAAELRAPRSGRVTARSAEVGQVVEAGTPLLEIADLDRVLLLVDLFPEMLARVEPGMAVEARLPGREEPVRGTIASIGAEVDPLTQAARARVPVPNPQGDLRPGTFVRVSILIGEPQDAIIVPAAAVVRDSLGQWVYVPAGTGYAPRAVEAQAVAGDSMALLRGVLPGEAVVLRGGYQLHQAQFTFKGLVTFGEEEEEEDDD